jgi:hypothetical protein
MTEPEHALIVAVDDTPANLELLVAMPFTGRGSACLA